MSTLRKLLPVAGLSAALVVSASAFAADYKVPRNSAGQPDFQGVWDFRNLTPLERPRELGNKATFTPEEQKAFKEKALAAVDVDQLRENADASTDVEGAYNAFWMDYGSHMNEDLRTSLIIDPPNGRLPDLTEQGKASLKVNAERGHYPVRDLFSIGLKDFNPEGPEMLGLSERCLQGFNAGPPLTPSAYNNNLRIIQTPDHVVLLTEMVHDARVIPLAKDAKPLPGSLRRWQGDSVGRWEGDTLVIETSNFTDKTSSYQLPIDLQDPTRNGAVGTGANVHLIERLTRVSDSRLDYEYTLTDLKTFSGPFTVSIPLKATSEQMFEYACHEGNFGARNMLTGARQAEKEAMASK